MKYVACVLTVACSAAIVLGGCHRVTSDSSGMPGRVVERNGAAPLGPPMLEYPTLRSLGAYWIIQGDENKQASVSLQYRAAGDKGWTQGADLFRVQKGANDMGAPSKREEHTKLPIPKNAWLFAGSAPLLKPDTAYDLKLTLTDGDGHKTGGTLHAHTIREPIAPKNLTVRHVVPGDGGGTGSESDPFKGLAAADAAARPGTVFLVHKGIYPPVVITHSGEPGRPVVYRGAGDGEAMIRGAGAKKTSRAVEVVDQHDVWFEKLSVSDAENGIVGHESSRLVIRRCKITGCDYGINATTNKKDHLEGFWISDNTIVGPSVWPRSKGIEDARGIQITGTGHDVCYNFVKGFGDGIDTYQGPRCQAIDFHNNEIERCTDDGSEMDYSERNTRNFENRYTNTYQGISTQPIFGGPVYIFRNVIYNIGVEPFKIHDSPSGVLIFHNTLVRHGIPELVMTPAEMDHYFVRNNLFVGSAEKAGVPAKYALDLDLGKIVNSDWDYDGFAGGPWTMFMRWQAGDDYKTLEEVRKDGPAERHAVVVNADTVFASGAKVPASAKVEQEPQDLRLSPGSEAVDAGVALKGLNDGYKGKAPDLGAYELGQALPHYGPRAE